MYILKNAIRNIGRNSRRNMLVGALMLIVIAVSSSALAINRAAGRAINASRNKYGAVVTISPDIDKLISANPNPDEPGLRQTVTNIAAISTAQYKDFARSEYLKSSSLAAILPVAGPSLTAVDQDKNGIFKGTTVAQDGSSALAPTMRLIGDSDTASIEDFKQGLRKIEAGRMYEGVRECVVSRDLAAVNHLSVGDTISVSGAASPSQAEYSLIVTGIYSDATQAYGDDQMQNSYLNRRNEILTTFETVAGRSGSGNPGASIQAAYILKNPALLKAFTAELRAKGLPASYLVSTDIAGFNDAAGALMSLRLLSLAAMFTAVAIGAVVLAFVTRAGLKKRRQEIGLLRVMGMKKGKVARGLFYEALVVAAACLLVGLVVGTVAAQPVARSFLAHPAASAKVAHAVPSPGFGMVLVKKDYQQIGISMSGVQSDTKPISSIDVTPDFVSALQAALVTLALATASGAVSARFVFRSGPAKALPEKP